MQQPINGQKGMNSANWQQQQQKQQQQHPLAKLWSFQSVRLQMTLMLMFAFLVFSLMRGNLGMALMCMVERNRSSATEMADHNTDLQVHWSATDISLMHMSIYVGVFVCTFLTQNYAQRFGPKAMISVGLVVNVLCTWAVPLAVYWVPHFSSVSALRFLIGLSQGFFIPCASLLIAKWFPETEKSIAMAIFTTGNQLGIAIAMFTTAELCKLPFLAGWPTSFFLYGLFGILLLAFWHPFATDKPRQSKRITAAELAHIGNVRIGKRRRRSATVIVQTPYRQLLLSPVVLAICMCSFAQSFVFVAMISYLPEFYHSVLDLNLTSNGIWSALPFLVQMVSKIALTFAANSAQRHFSAQFITKCSNNLASFGCAFCMLVVSLNLSPALMLAFLCAAFAFLSGYVPGYNTSIVCVAPPFTAAVSAYGQAYAQLASILAPIIIGHLTGESSEHAWSLVFQVLVAILVISGLCFQFFGSVEVQVWAQTDMMSSDSISSNSRINARIQRISEANDQWNIEVEEEEEEGKEDERRKRTNKRTTTKKVMKGKTMVEISVFGIDDEEEEAGQHGMRSNNNNKNGANGARNASSECGSSRAVDFPRMHHRLSTLDA